MNNSIIEKSLVELEQSLVQINSARTQVSTVAEKSERLILSINSALKTLTELNSGVNGELEMFVADLENKLSQIDKRITDFNSSSEITAKKTEENYVQLSKTLKKNISELDAAFNGFLLVFEKTQNKIAEFDLKNEFTSLKNDSNSNFIEFKNGLVTGIEEKLNASIETTTGKIFSRLDEIEKANRSRQNRNLFFLCVGIVLISVLVLINGMK
jgi:uncharacterized protein YkvS